MSSRQLPPSSPRRLLASLSLALPLVMLADTASAAVLISQVYGGGAATSGSPSYKHDYIELRNTGAEAVSLSGLSLQYGSSTGTGSWSSLSLSGTIPAHGFFLVRTNTTGTLGADLPTPDLSATNGLNLSASNGKVALVNGTSALSGACPTANVLDLVGYGSANCAEGTATPALTNMLAALRSNAGCTDTGSNSADFSTGTPAARNSATTATACSGSGGGSGGGGTGTTPVDLTIGAIQGESGTSPHVGKLVRSSGVVTKLTNTGFFMQSLTGDGNDATSDGILVFTSSAPTVSPGQLVQVTATVTEFATGSSTVTELTSPSVVVQGDGYTIAPTAVTLPVAGGLERFEGMLVTLSGPLTVNQNYFQARYGQLTLSAGGRLEVPTNRHRPGAQAQALMADNAARRVVLDDGSSLQNVNPTAFTSFNGIAAAPRGGDSFSAITGVIDYGPSTATASGIGDYRILPLNNSTLTYSNSHPRLATAPAVGGNVKLASFNVLNYFTSFTDGNAVTATGAQTTSAGCTLGGATATSNCRGANSLDEFQRQQAKIVAAISSINADALGLMEIQNNSVAAQNLVHALNTQMGSGTYAVAPGAAAGVVGTDAIKTTVIYKPAKLAPVGNSVTDTDEVNNRPTLAQHFATANGERFTLVVNHFKSKGSCPSAGDADYAGNFDAGDGQGCWNGLRTQQANRLRSFVGQLQSSASGSANVVVVGDLNAYAQEDPVYALTSNGFVDQIGRFHSFGYSYVFDGAAGRLDHAITSAALSAKVSGVAHWHINADESLAHDYNREFKQPACATCATDPYAATVYRSSDHDPVVLGLGLYKYITGTAARDTLTGTAGDDLITGGVGADTLTGGAGTNLYIYNSMRDAGDLITDFVPGKDWVDLRQLLAGLGWTGSNPVAEGRVRFVASGTGTALEIDADGPAGAGGWRGLVTFANVSPAAFSTQPSLIAR
ncbi:ExeM/NucH family extracellular endonuclease [Aquabacterium sp. OR-4]|uniref:ExeM/NucH family extracellular endonuclease n=1 Tax=Aquabacterium sp. OR-4 TaxID=2978127 RepID=UPI0028C6C5B5|nr:ExeM/NucH family extracellular endonuclease [Aquabacterium sp. OR-4]MDT7837608.1 ExeM/NucH family extracellular endonuclease [Aquabacterium sp. OR-4]